MPTFALQKEPIMIRERIIVTTRLSERQPMIGLDEIHPDHPAVRDGLVPLGSVEFVRQYAEAAGIALPDDLSYPKSLRKHLYRPIRAGLLSEAQPSEFVKPRGQIKAFTGSIKANLMEPVNPEAPVWIAPFVKFLAEWRVYVHQGKAMGHARYDDAAPDYDLDVSAVNAMISEYPDAPVAYSLDVGLMDNGLTALVEINDAWALGYYGHSTMAPSCYIDMLVDRWDELKQQSASPCRSAAA